MDSTAQRLRELQAANPRSIAMLLETPAAHFPVLQGCLRSAKAGREDFDTDDASDWDGYALGALEYARQLASRPNGMQVIELLIASCRGCLASPPTLAKGAAEMQILTAVAILEVNACPLKSGDGAPEAPCSRRRAASDARCLLKQLKRPLVRHLRTWLTQRVKLDCQPRRNYEPGYRQRIERSVAATHSVSLLRRFDVRAAWHGTHPGMKRGILDCIHNSLTPGTFEPEVFGLTAELERRSHTKSDAS